MSGSVALKIVTGSDWAVRVAWTDSTNDPIAFTDVSMQIRQELSPQGTIIASLDESGTKDGTITLPATGTALISMPAARTTSLQTGHGFWDIFVTVNGARTRLVFGTIDITPHVTVI